MEQEEQVRSTSNQQEQVPSFDVANFPALTPTEDDGCHQTAKILFSDIVAQWAVETALPAASACQHDKSMPLTQTNDSTSTVTGREGTNMKRHEESKWEFQRPLRSSQRYRLYTPPADPVLIDVNADFRVQIPAHLVHGASLRQLPHSSTPSQTKSCIGNKRKALAVGQKSRWFSCPDCVKRCSTEMFLLDHFIRRHVQHQTSNCTNPSDADTNPSDADTNPSDADTNPSDADTNPSDADTNPSDPDTNPSDADTNPSDVDTNPSDADTNPSDADTNPSDADTNPSDADTNPSNAETNPSDAETKFSNTTCQSPLHLDEVPACVETTNLNQMRLMLSNDVEQNPGPTYTCHWGLCAFNSAMFGEMNAHLIQHTAQSQHCKWMDCSWEHHDKLKMEIHVLQHLYNDQTLFPTLNHWLSTFPGKRIQDNITNLQLCPIHLRSHLLLPLFDEDFNIPSDNYTVERHLDYLDYLSMSNYSTLYNLVTSFIAKRKSLGENWDNPRWNIGQSGSLKTDNKPCPLSKEIYTVKQFKPYVHVHTSRPELVSSSFSGTVLKSRSKQQKRKQNVFQEDLDCSDQSWRNVLVNNLSVCSNAVSLQVAIERQILNNGIITPKSQSFVKLEQEAIKLAAIQNCSGGNIVFTIFKCTINEENVYYVRYVETGAYTGCMVQKLAPIIKDKFGITDDQLLLVNCCTEEHLQALKNVAMSGDVKRNRPDKKFNYAVSNLIPNALKELQDTPNTPEIELVSYFIHLLPYRNLAMADAPSKVILQTLPADLDKNMQDLLVNFRQHKALHIEVSSKAIFSAIVETPVSLYHQSLVLNCLSSNIKDKSHLFTRAARYDSNFTTCASYLGTSLRIKTIQLYSSKNINELFSFYMKYFPELTTDIPVAEPVQPAETTVKRRKVVKTVRKIQINTAILQEQVKMDIHVTKQDETSLYDQYVCSLLDHGKLSIQVCEEGTLACILNNYSETNGSFLPNDFICTVKLQQETGCYIYCSCGIYRTLVQLQNVHATNEDIVVLDYTGQNCVTCMHCKFIKSCIMPNLEINPNQTVTRMQRFVQDGLQDVGKEIVEVSRNQTTRKFSVMTHNEDCPSFIHLTFNKRVGKYIVSCKSSSCQIVKGHKKTVDLLDTSSLCSHLSILKQYRAGWEDLLDAEPIEQTGEHLDNTFTNDEHVDDTGNFDQDTGLWKFKCRSSHSPSKKDSALLKLNVIKRDQWTDGALPRLSDGCLKGPSLFPDVPDNTCPCGSGWLKREDDEQYSENGLIVHDNKRALTIYTDNAPVKCEIYNRICYNPIDPCKILWNEGQLDSLHVLSRDTAAGDEIGWEFVSLVINSGCTFSSFCTLKTDNYKLRNNRASFMDSSVFINWWFSWAANMKIDFRKPCGICGFEPKRLCCDGTKVGVGFRNANFEEISKCDNPDIVNPTIHRRMDRCFLKTMNGINKQQMITNRGTLDYIARHTLGQLKPDEILPENDMENRIHFVKQVLPDEVLPSFERFFTMSEMEKIAYAYVLKMLASTASITSLLPPQFCNKLQAIINTYLTDMQFNEIMSDMRSFAPEIRDLVSESMLNNNNLLPDDIKLFLQCMINQSLDLSVTEPEQAIPQPGTYNPEKYGRAYYFNESGLKLRNVRKFSIDEDTNVRRNIDHDDQALDFERCQKLYSKIKTSAPGTSTLFLWFCADHGHCYGFHMTGNEGRKDPAASLYSHLATPPSDVFYDFACNLQEYCLNRESGYYKSVRFFHDIFHGYAHKCSCAFRSGRLQGFESVNSEICEQFNSFIQCIKKSARQMSQSHFCFYLQFFLHEWNERKRLLYNKKIRVALAGLR